MKYNSFPFLHVFLGFQLRDCFTILQLNAFHLALLFSSTMQLYQVFIDETVANRHFDFQFGQLMRRRQMVVAQYVSQD